MIPLQHIHPMLVHFPIVFFLTLAAFDVIAAFRGTEIGGRSRAGTISFGLALLAGLSAIAAFVRDVNELPRSLAMLILTSWGRVSPTPILLFLESGLRISCGSTLSTRRKASWWYFAAVRLSRSALNTSCGRISSPASRQR